MKKLLILFAMITMLAACGNKAVTEEQATDTLATDTPVTVDDTVEAVEVVEVVDAEVAE